MKTFSIIEPISEKFLDISARKYGLDPERVKERGYPQEDFLLVSEKYPIFVVADGVTLIQFLWEKKEYPHPSPAGTIAQVFCEALLKAAEAKYESFTESDTKEIFRTANEAAGEYNRKQGRTKESIDYWNTDLYAATAAFVVIKNNIAYWGSICDSYVAHYNTLGTLLLLSPQCRDKKEAEPFQFTGDPNDPIAKAKYSWSTRRNGINKDGKLVGYGVVTGEDAANNYLNYGSFEVKKGDVVTVITDGFENYVKLAEFISLFQEWPEDFEKHFKKFTAGKSTEDPDMFGRERSLIAVSVE